MGDTLEAISDFLDRIFLIFVAAVLTIPAFIGFLVGIALGLWSSGCK